MRFILVPLALAGLLLSGGSIASEQPGSRSAANPLSPGKITPLTGKGVVTVASESGNFTLLRDGEPYVIKGAGVGRGYLRSFALNGGTSIRTWDPRTEYLDGAAELGLTVAMGLRVGLERKGFDYDDEQAVAEQLERLRGEVLKYKDHPALLTWIIGNEVNLQFTNPKVFDAVNDISRMIHEVDGKHPTTMALAGFSGELAELVETRAPDLDFVSIQLYHGMLGIQETLAAMDYRKPIFFTEWGSKGHWEVDKTAWGAPIEQTSSEKARHYRESYERGIASSPGQVMGAYVFLWSQKQERTPTWYGMFLKDGSETETIDVLHHIWNGKWPENRAPQLKSFKLDGKRASQNVMLKPGTGYKARVKAKDVDGDELRYRWVVMRETNATQVGGDREDIPATLEGLVEEQNQRTVRVTSPVDPGAYRLFVYVYDDYGHAAHANIPFLVTDSP